MSALILARIQFAATIMFHYLFPPLTIGLAVILTVMAFMRLRRKDAVSEAMLRFWVHIFGLNFAMGVATGIVMEFQFGTNWSRYSRFVGDIFGAPLAAEGIFAFFLESVFLAVLLFGWKRVSPRVHAFSALMVALGSTLSAFWIIVANSWQQTPAGYHLVDGRAELTDFWAAVFNPSTLPRFTHTVAGAWITGAFFVMGVSAWYLLKGRHLEVARRSLKIALLTAVAATILSLLLGDWHTRQVARTQPAKFAAMEALFETQEGAPLLLLGYPLPELGIQKLLSFMVYYDFNAEIKGLDAFPPEDLPPVAATAISFHAMVWAGFLMILVALVGLFLLWRRKLFDARWYLRVLLWMIPLPFLVNQLGWLTAEVGRQPWIVYGLLRTEEAFSPSVPAWQILVSLIMFTLIYAALFALGIYLMRRFIVKGPEIHPNGKEVA